MAVGTAQGAFSFVKNTVIGTLQFAAASDGERVVMLAETASTTVQEYSERGASGVANAVLDQGAEGATAIVTEAVLTGGLAATSRVNSIKPVSGVQANRAAGLSFEAQVLKNEGLSKNTAPIRAVDPKTGQTGTTIPDGIRSSGQTVDAKGGRTVSDSAQLRRQSQASQQAGQKAQVVVKKGTKVSKTVRDRMDVKEQ